MSDFKFKNLEISDRGKVANIEIQYPRNGEFSEVKVGICDVRAADSIRVRYDFERDGYSILQASNFDYPQENPIPENWEDWQEVAFIRAWGREKNK